MGGFHLVPSNDSAKESRKNDAHMYASVDSKFIQHQNNWHRIHLEGLVRLDQKKPVIGLFRAGRSEALYNALMTAMRSIFRGELDRKQQGKLFSLRDMFEHHLNSCQGFWVSAFGFRPLFHVDQQKQMCSLVTPHILPLARILPLPPSPHPSHAYNRTNLRVNVLSTLSSESCDCPHLQIKT